MARGGRWLPVPSGYLPTPPCRYGKPSRFFQFLSKNFAFSLLLPCRRARRLRQKVAPEVERWAEALLVIRQLMILTRVRTGYGREKARFREETMAALGPQIFFIPTPPFRPSPDWGRRPYDSPFFSICLKGLFPFRSRTESPLLSGLGAEAAHLR